VHQALLWLLAPLQCLLVRLVMLLVLLAAHLESFACPFPMAARNTYGRLERIGYPARARPRLLPPAPGPAGTPRYFPPGYLPPLPPPFVPPSTLHLIPSLHRPFHFSPLSPGRPRACFLPAVPAQLPLLTPACCACCAVQACGWASIATRRPWWTRCARCGARWTSPPKWGWCTTYACRWVGSGQ
jgi:hypothetical protein